MGIFLFTKDAGEDCELWGTGEVVHKEKFTNFRSNTRRNTSLSVIRMLVQIASYGGQGAGAAI